MIEEFRKRGQKFMEDISMEFKSTIKCHRVSFSSCQVLEPPAVSQHGLICLQFSTISAPPRISDITSCPAVLDWTMTLNTLDQLLIGPLLHFPSCQSMAVPAEGFVLNEVMKSTSCFCRGPLFCLHSMRSSWLMTGPEGHFTPLTHTHKNRSYILTENYTRLNCKSSLYCKQCSHPIMFPYCKMVFSPYTLFF